VTTCLRLPGLKAQAGDITELLRDLPIPIPDNIPGMTRDGSVRRLLRYDSVYTKVHITD
jgi:hypothetical protein